MIHLRVGLVQGLVLVNEEMFERRKRTENVFPGIRILENAFSHSLLTMCFESDQRSSAHPGQCSHTSASDAMSLEAIKGHLVLVWLQKV